MKLLRFRKNGHIYKGVADEDSKKVVYNNGDRSESLNDIEILPPSSPTKIVAVGLNYKKHAAELSSDPPDEPILFLKPPSALIPHGGTIVLPELAGRIDLEAELAMIVSRRSCKVAACDARDHIEGFTCFNDVTARDLQKRDVQWTRAKSFDTFAPVGPWIETETPAMDSPIISRINGQKKQDSLLSDMIFDPFELFQFISSIMTLFPGDIIATGTPSGITPINRGDTVTVEIGGIGNLINIVA
jgi:2-keto-4-pentenoate hydratase/2-oxohepta-3-ene-1,7-dioic acid hydratase in catechol pathway